MIVGIGTDLIEIERIKKACEKEAFLVRVYTEEERRQAGGKVSRQSRRCLEQAFGALDCWI